MSKLFTIKWRIFYMFIVRLCTSDCTVWYDQFWKGCHTLIGNDRTRMTNMKPNATVMNLWIGHIGTVHAMMSRLFLLNGGLYNFIVWLCTFWLYFLVWPIFERVATPWSAMTGLGWPTWNSTQLSWNFASEKLEGFITRTCQTYKTFYLHL